MNFLFYLKVEINRIFHNKSTYLIILLSCLSPLLGYKFYTPATMDTKAAIYIANPVLAGTVGSSILFGLFILYELNRIHKEQTDVITDSIVSPVTLYWTRFLSVMSVSFVTIILTMIVYFPYTVTKVGNVFTSSLYLFSYLIIMLPGMWIASLITAFLYQLTRRVDLSVVLFVVTIIPCYTVYFADEFLLRWINPIVPIFSDDFSNTRTLLTVLYNRMFWLIALIGLFIISTLFVRCYGKGLFGTTVHNSRKIYLPILAIILLVTSSTVYHNQPFYNHAPADVLEREPKLDEKAYLMKTHVDAKPNVKKHTHHGTATYEIINKNKKVTDQYLMINPGYKIESFTANGQPVDYTDLKQHIINDTQIRYSLPADEKITLVIVYSGYPMEWQLDKQLIGTLEIDDKYIYLTSSSFLPQLDMKSYNDSPVITADIQLPEHLKPILSNGTLQQKKKNKDGTITWNTKDVTDRIDLYAADYVSETVAGDKMSLDLYYSQKHQRAMDQLNIKEAAKEVMNYCTKHYGPLIFSDQNNNLKLLQASAYMFGGYARNGTSLMGESTFSVEALNDPQRGPNSQEIMAHEMVHQWWGLGVMFYDDFGGVWSAEGLTVYTTYRMMKEKYGEAYAKKHYVDVWQEAVTQQNRDFYNRNPEYIGKLPEKYAMMITANNSGINFYSRMPLMLLKAATLVGGEDKLDDILAKLFQEKSGDILTYDDFLNACKLTKEDLQLD